MQAVRIAGQQQGLNLSNAAIGVQLTVANWRDLGLSWGWNVYSAKGSPAAWAGTLPAASACMQFPCTDQHVA